MSRQEYIDAASSKKVTLVKLEATKRFVNYTSLGAGVYFKQVPQFVVGLKDNQGNTFTKGANASVSPGEFYYDIQTSTLYVHAIDSSDVNLSVLISTVQVFYSTYPVSLPHDLQDGSFDVYWDGRVEGSPQFKSKIGIDQNLVSSIGTGTVKLSNTDGALDEIYDTLIFENQKVEVYSYADKQPLSESRLIFVGVVHDKSYDSEAVNFTVKDQLFNLLENVPQGIFDETDGVNSDAVGNVKRWVYGRVDGLKAQSIDQIGDGYLITGTVSSSNDANTLNLLTGTGTNFLSETSPGDLITIGTQEFRIESVEDDTNLTLDDEVDFLFTGQTAILRPEVPTVTKNRDFFIAEHATAQLNRTVVRALQFNRVELDSTVGILAGDILEFVDFNERVEVRNVSPGNIVVLQQNLINLPPVGGQVIRRPIQDVLINGVRASAADYVVNNSTTTTVTLDPDIEFNVAPISNLNQSLTFTNGSRIVTGGTELTQILKTRDYIRSEEITFTKFYEILSVTDTEITLREPVTEPTVTDTAEFKSPNYIGDDTIISVNLLGKTKDGTPTGEWIQTSADVVRDLVSEIGLTERINDVSFDETSTKTPQLVSLMLPLTPSGGPVKVKTAVDLLAQSTNCALALNNDLELTFGSTLVVAPEDVTIVDDSDVVRWSIKSKSGQLYKFSNVRYRHGDIDRATLEAGTQLAFKTSKFVNNYVGTAKTVERDVYLYDKFDADIMSERILYYNSLSLTEIKLETDLRLEGLEIGDIVQLEFTRLYKRFGDDSRKKLASVAGRTVTGDRLVIELTDFGNTFNTSAFITPNDAPNYDLSNEDQKIKNGYITDPQGIVNDVEKTAEINKIS